MNSPVIVIAVVMVASNTIASPGCPTEGSLPLVDGNGMSWAISGLEPKNLPMQDIGRIKAWASAWKKASEEAGMALVILNGLTKDVTSWGAVQKKTGGIGRYDFRILDAIVEAFEGHAVLVLSAECAWDHKTGIKPSDRASFRDYVKVMVKRYDGDDDFGISDGSDPSYPDVDGSGTTTIADSETSKEEKLKWAKAHRVAAYMLETTSTPEGAGLEDYAELAKETITTALSASPTVEIWLAPFSATMARSEWQARFGSMSLPVSSKGHVAAIIDVLGTGSDFTEKSAIERFGTIAQWYKEAGLLDIRLILGGVGLGVSKGVFDCPDTRCSQEMQAEQATKIVALVAATKARAVVFANAVEPSASSGTGFAILDFKNDIPKVTVRPAGEVLRFVRTALAGDGTASTVPTGAPPVPSTTAIRTRSCENEVDFIAWYDWTDEVAAGAPYNDLVKKIRLPVHRDSLETVILDGQMSAAAPTETGPDGMASILVGRSPVLAIARTKGPEFSDASDISEQQPDMEEVSETSSQGSGCTASVVGSPLPIVLIGLLWRRIWRR